MELINISVENKRALTLGTPVIVCGNSDYQIEFTFDEEWSGLPVKTVRFTYVKDGKIRYTDIVMDGATVNVPVMTNVREVLVGVFAGDLVTTTPARVPCDLSIRCGTGAVDDPTPSQYDQIMALLNNGGGGGGGTPNAVQYVEQELTEEQQAQARENIGAMPATTKIPSKPEDVGAQPAGHYLTAETDPTVPDWAKQPSKPTYTASEVGALPSTTKIPSKPEEVGADPAGTAGNAVSAHNTNTEAHNDMRLQLQALTDRLNAFFDSDDTTLDELSEIVTYIKSNKTLIDSITTSKVNVSDIIDNLITNVANKPLSAAQGVVLKSLIDALSTAKLDTSKLQEAIDTALAQAKASGEFDGEDGVRGKSMLRITTAPTAYTTETGGFTPAYRIALSTVLSQSGATEVMVGDTILRNYYTYPVGYVDASYVYIGKYASIRGSAGSSVTITGITESTEPGGENTVTFSDEKTLTVKNGAPGVSPTVSISKSGTVTTITITDESGPKTVKLNDGKDYVLTDADRSAIAALVKPLLKTETWTFELEDGSVVTKDVMLA